MYRVAHKKPSPPSMVQACFPTFLFIHKLINLSHWKPANKIGKCLNHEGGAFLLRHPVLVLYQQDYKKYPLILWLERGQFFAPLICLGLALTSHRLSLLALSLLPQSRKCPNQWSGFLLLCVNRMLQQQQQQQQQRQQQQQQQQKK